MSSIYGVSLSLLAGIGRGEALAMVAAAGFREVELPAGSEVLGNWVAAPAATRRALDAAGLLVRSVHTAPDGWLNADPDEAVRLGSVRAACACLRAAAEVGARTVVWHANYHGTAVPADLQPASRALSRDSLAAFAARAWELGLRVAVENTPQIGNPRPFTTVEDVLRLIAGFGPEVGVCLDAGHSRANGLDPADEARLAGGRLFAVHLQDNPGPGPDCHLVPERDMAGWDRLAATLDEIGYSGGRMFEIHPAAAEGDRAAALARLAALAGRWATVGGRRSELP
ncbi:MAG TPA: sugar phosphate isomerase/epimerase family protein [Planctomycetota bacterium]|nr:sugar phosphate isomerase/epimerase family protein [Planctomycetota bacterium]